MSEVESKKGTLRKVEPIDGETLEDVCKRICLFECSIGEKPDYFEGYTEYLRAELYRRYVIYEGAVYEVIEVSDLEESDIFESKDNSDGTIGFLVQFYNGGCSFDEAIEYALKNKKD